MSSSTTMAAAGPTAPVARPPTAKRGSSRAVSLPLLQLGPPMQAGAGKVPLGRLEEAGVRASACCTFRACASRGGGRGLSWGPTAPAGLSKRLMLHWLRAQRPWHRCVGVGEAGWGPGTGVSVRVRLAGALTQLFVWRRQWVHAFVIAYPGPCLPSPPSSILQVEADGSHSHSHSPSPNGHALVVTRHTKAGGSRRGHRKSMAAGKADGGGGGGAAVQLIAAHLSGPRVHHLQARSRGWGGCVHCLQERGGAGMACEEGCAEPRNHSPLSPPLPL